MPGQAMEPSGPYARLRARLREIGAFHAAYSLLAWDQETLMPRKAATFRAEALSLLSRRSHEAFIRSETQELVEAAASDPAVTGDPVEAANLRAIRRDLERATRLPASLVAELSKVASQGLEAWKQARARSEFRIFEPWLRRQVKLHQEKAACYGAPEEGEPYDALAEDYEPGMRAAHLERVFAQLRPGLASLVHRYSGRTSRSSDPVASLRLPVPAQQRFNREVAARVGFDFHAGRLDESTHPFTEGIAPGDTRITTRYAEDKFTQALLATLHEVGHGLYEQGLPKDERMGEPLAQAAGLGIHESQSRTWENQVGRSLAFWEWVFPLARDCFGADLADAGPESVFRSVNRVTPSLIRVEADETTYNLHIMIRFDIERALIRGELDPGDVPAVWNRRMEEDLGVRVPDDARGCLQDIHWAMGTFGYFPTYTLGNLYAAQFWRVLAADLGDPDEAVRSGRFDGLLQWLRERVHRHGRRYLPAELCREITGSEVDPAPLLSYLEAKLERVYS